MRSRRKRQRRSREAKKGGDGKIDQKNEDENKKD